MENEIAAIRARHEAVELALQTTGLRSQDAHTDRATLLLALTEAQERAERAEGRVDTWRIDMIAQLPELYWQCYPHGPNKNEHALTLWEMLRTSLNSVAFPPRAAQTLKERKDG